MTAPSAVTMESRCGAIVDRLFTVVDMWLNRRSG